MAHHLDVYACTNRLRCISPQQKLWFAIATLLIALMAQISTQLLIVLWLAVWTVGYARIPIKVYLQVLMAAGLFLVTSLLALVLNLVSIEQMVSVQQDQVGGVAIANGYLWVSRSGLVQALQIGMRSIACTSCLLFVLLTTPFTDLLQVLRQWRVPVLLTELLLLMYRFIFLLLAVMTELQLAQRARGGYRTRQRWIYSVGLLVSQLLVRSLQHYQHFSLALAARGFNGSFRVEAGQSYFYSKRYAIEAIAGCVGLMILELKIRLFPGV
ncbi:MAG: cobalt ECF transporter T component CbiQ [Limnothrix sp. BL-A-16]